MYLVRHPDRYPHHLASALFVAGESARLAEFLDHVDVAVSLHGYGRIGRGTQLLAGGGNRALAAHVARHLALPGYHVVTELDDIPLELRGLHPQNPVNRPVTAERNWSCRSGSGASARAARCPAPTACPR